MDMFASDTPEPIRLTQSVTPWGLSEKLDRERAAIGFHISAHPLDPYSSLFGAMNVWSYAELEAEVKDRGGSSRRLAGAVVSRSDRRTKKGTPMMVVTLSDPSGSYEVIGFSEDVQKYGPILQPGANVIIGVEGEERDDGVSLRIQSAQLLDDAAQKVGKSLEIEADDPKCLNAIQQQLKPGGNGRVKFIVAREQGRRLYEIDIGATWQVSPALAGAIKSFDGVVDVRLS